MERKRLLVPKPISYSGKEKRTEGKEGTQAFVPSDTRIPPNLSGYELQKFLRHLGHDAPYFIKPVNAETRDIRKQLSDAGVGVERELMDLKDGTALFEKTGHSLDSPEGQRIFADDPLNFLSEVQKAVTRIHNLGIKHTHLHGGNIAVTPEGKVFFLDWSQARRFDASQTPNAFAEVKNDLQHVAQSLALTMLTCRGINAQDVVPVHDGILKGIWTGYNKDLLDKIPKDKFKAILKTVKD